MIKLILLSVFIPLILSCSNTCRGDETSPCYSISSYLYLHVEANNGKGISRFYSFCVQVDKFTKLTLNQSFPFMNENENSFIRVHAPPFVALSQIKNGNETENRRFFFHQRTKDLFVGYYSILLNLKGGVLSNQTFSFDSSCKPGTGYLPLCLLDSNRDCVRELDCAINARESEDRDVKLYIGFSGTDGSSRPLQSSSLIPSKFSAYTYGNMMDRLTKLKQN